MHVDRDHEYTNHIDVFFDGAKHTRCVEADDVEGWCVVASLTEDGRMKSPAFHIASPDEFDFEGMLVHKIYGDVVIEIDAPERKEYVVPAREALGVTRPERIVPARAAFQYRTPVKH